MRATEPNTWLPTTEQIITASQRAILAALDTNLLLTQRALEAEHADQLSDEDSIEPNPPHLALAQSILIMSVTLRQLIASYYAVIDRMLGDA
jgi:hypothetical protein